MEENCSRSKDIRSKETQFSNKKLGQEPVQDEHTQDKQGNLFQAEEETRHACRVTCRKSQRTCMTQITAIHNLHWLDDSDTDEESEIECFDSSSLIRLLQYIWSYGIL